MNYKLLIEKVADYINEGFGNIGGRIENAAMLDCYLMAAAHKAIRFSRAIINLCEENFTNESMPILRSLIEHTINMRWIMKKDTEKRLEQYWQSLEKKGFGGIWTNVNLLDRMSEIGFKNRDYYDFVVKVTYSYAHVNAETLDWGEVIMDEGIISKHKLSSGAVYSIVAHMLGHVLFALNAEYKGKFNYCGEIWSHFKKSSKDIRKEFETIISGLKV